MGRYSFPVRLFHSQLHAGLSRRIGRSLFWADVSKNSLLEATILPYNLVRDPFEFWRLQPTGQS